MNLILLKVEDEAEVYGAMRRLIRFRMSKNPSRAVLKKQMLRDLDQLWPNLVKYSKSSQGLFANLWESKVAKVLFKLKLLPQEIANFSPQELIKLSKKKGCSGLGPNEENQLAWLMVWRRKEHE